MRRGLLTALLAAQVMVSMDGSIVTVALPHVRAGLHASDAVLQLVTGAYILALAVLVVTGARLGDLFGHRRVFLAGVAAFGTASLACGLAPGGAALVAARAAQGAAGALVLPQVLALIQLHFAGAARVRALGLYSTVLALGVAIGQIAGGVIVGWAGWRPVFLVNVPVAAAVVLAGPRVLPGAVPGGRRRLDLAGVALLSAGMAALVLPLVFGREQGWPAWTGVSLAAGCAGVALFVVHERRAAHPLLDLGVLRVPGVRAGLAACCCVMGAYTALLFCLALHLQTGLGYSPPMAGLAFLPYPLGFGAASLAWSRLPGRGLLPVAGPVVFAAAVVPVALAAGGGAYGPVAPLLVAAGAGHACGFAPLVERMSGAAGPGRASALSALVNTGTLLANVSAIAVLGGVYLAAPDPAGGLVRVAVLLTVLLAAGAACAWRAVRAEPPTDGGPPARPPTRDHPVAKR
ncbi:MFS transporter [Actinomadura parmotrematis]|uniref:MFS transporter n=1 Tax=Actinomadura parmotrematis TaxID=2864039 RepID=A0ABS7G1W3_9ACTN|nr:MFS transporter [Actinomadura parmotrematis]MBW8486696.1 MFS transporter [Actinomadura parmotrematis]